MADKNLGQHIDKISYAVGGVLGLGLLVLPFLVVGQVEDLTGDLNSKIHELDQKTRGQINPEAESRWLEREIRRQWQPGSSASEGVAWITEARPALAKVTRSVEMTPALHLAGTFESVAVMRDARRQQPYLVVKGGANSENEHVVVDSIKLLRSVDDADDFKEVAAFKGDDLKDGTFEYPDYDVSPGKTYSYKFVSHAVKAPDAPSNITDPEEAEQEADVLATTEGIPYDFSVKILQIYHPEGSDPEFSGSFKYWDYKNGAVVAHMPRQKIPERARIGGRYRVEQIDKDQGMIAVKDSVGRGRPGYTIKRGDDEFPIVLWEAVQAEGDAEEDGEEDGEEEDEAEPEAPAKKAPAPKPATGGSRRKKSFG